MSLRDYFAGQALMGALDGNVHIRLRGEGASFAEVHASLATHSYEIADAMLKARDR